MGEEGEISPAQWAIDLFTKHEYKREFYNVHLADIMFGTGGTLYGVVKNLFLRRPCFTGSQRLIFGGLLGMTIGRGVMLVSDHFIDKRDAMMVEYIRRYPHRFPEPPKRKYADIFNQWVPIR